MRCAATSACARRSALTCTPTARRSSLLVSVRRPAQLCISSHRIGSHRIALNGLQPDAVYGGGRCFGELVCWASKQVSAANLNSHAEVAACGAGRSAAAISPLAIGRTAARLDSTRLDSLEFVHIARRRFAISQLGAKRGRARNSSWLERRRTASGSISEPRRAQ